MEMSTLVPLPTCVTYSLPEELLNMKDQEEFYTSKPSSKTAKHDLPAELIFKRINEYLKW